MMKMSEIWGVYRFLGNHKFFVNISMFGSLGYKECLALFYRRMFYLKLLMNFEDP